MHLRIFAGGGAEQTSLLMANAIATAFEQEEIQSVHLPGYIGLKPVLRPIKELPGYIGLKPVLRPYNRDDRFAQPGYIGL